MSGEQVATQRALVQGVRFALGMTQAELAELLAADVRSVQRWEHGQSRLSGFGVRVFEVLRDDPQRAEWFRG